MIIGIGIDLIEIKRIEKALQRNNFSEKLFTEHERQYCDARKTLRVHSYAARYAAKEAVAKAFGFGFRGSLSSLVDIEIKNDENGAPFVVLKGGFLDMAEKKNVSKIFISLTHSKEYAIAEVILWSDSI